MRALFLSIIFITASCVSQQNFDIGVVRLHNDFMELNGQKYESIEALVKEAALFSELHLNTHPCLKSGVAVRVMKEIQKLRSGVIYAGIFGNLDGDKCH